MVILDENFKKFIDILREIESAISSQASESIDKIPPLGDLLLRSLGTRIPANDFQYREKISEHIDFPIARYDELISSIANLYSGSIRPYSNNFFLNIHPAPNLYAVAAACLSLYHNIDGLMDEYSGSALLYEQKIIREVSSWIGWNNAAGTSTSGGKATISYAIRSALSKVHPDYKSKGIPKKTVILASAGIHYSLIQTVSILGLGTENCWLIPMTKSNELDCDALRGMLQKAWSDRMNVAAIICCGGSTIDFQCDNLTDVYKTVRNAYKDFNVAKLPHLHVDSVIGWQFFSLNTSWMQSQTAQQLTKLSIDNISEIKNRFGGIQYFDSCGADFHKNGFCPIASSFYIAKNNRFMKDLALTKNIEPFTNAKLGQHRPYLYTIENSRNISGVFSAWAVLAQYGRDGLEKALLELYLSKENFQKAFKKSSHFAPILSNGLGVEISFGVANCTNNQNSIDFANDLRGFCDYCKELSFLGYNIPLFGIVQDNNDCNLLIYPNRFVSSEDAERVVADLEQLWEKYNNTERKCIERPFSSKADPIK